MSTSPCKALDSLYPLFHHYTSCWNQISQMSISLSSDQNNLLTWHDSAIDGNMAVVNINKKILPNNTSRMKTVIFAGATHFLCTDNAIQMSQMCFITKDDFRTKFFQSPMWEDSAIKWLWFWVQLHLMRMQAEIFWQDTRQCGLKDAKFMRILNQYNYGSDAFLASSGMNSLWSRVKFIHYSVHSLSGRTIITTENWRKRS